MATVSAFCLVDPATLLHQCTAICAIFSEINDWLIDWLMCFVQRQAATEEDFQNGTKVCSVFYTRLTASKIVFDPNAYITWPSYECHKSFQQKLAHHFFILYWGTFTQFLVFRRLLVSELGDRGRQTDRRTDGRTDGRTGNTRNEAY